MSVLNLYEKFSEFLEWNFYSDLIEEGKEKKEKKMSVTKF